MEKYTFEKRTFLAVCPLHPPLVAVEVVYLYLLIYNMAYAVPELTTQFNYRFVSRSTFIDTAPFAVLSNKRKGNESVID